MAGEWGWNAAALFVTFVGWFISPVITSFLPKILACLGFDASKKLQGLEIHTIPELKKTLQAVDQERMMQRGKRVKTDLDALDKLAAMLRHALEDAEDIFDDAQHKSALRCCHHLRRAFSACVALCIVRTKIVRTKSAWLLQWARPRTPEKPRHPVTTIVAVSDTDSDNETVPVTTGVVASDELDPATTLWIARIVRAKSAWLVQWARNISLSLFHRRTPVPVNISAAVSDKPSQVTIDISASGGEPDPMTTSDLAVPVTTGAAASGKLDPVTFPVINLTGVAAFDNQTVPMTTGAAASDELDTVTTSAAASNNETVQMTTGDVASDVLDPATTGAEASGDEIVPVTTSALASEDESDSMTTSVEAGPVTTLSDSSGRWLSCLCSSFDMFKNRVKSLCSWLAHLFEAACFFRDWSHEVIGIKKSQENASLFDMLDIFSTAISRMKLKKQIQKIENTVSEVKKSSLLGVASNTTQNDIANKNRSKIRTSSKRKVFGREALRDNIMAKLRETSPSLGTSPCYSVIGIYGVAGSGKTTFARYTRDYIEEKCKEEKLFDTIMCIHVSKTFSVDDIFHEMLKDITKDRHSNISDREELEEKLKEALRGKRFFLILDDLWVKNKHDAQLEELISPLIVGAKGSKILVTARTKHAAGALCANELIKMPELVEDEYLKMFMHYALDGTSGPNEKFISVGREIAKKLHGSPIAAVTVAGRLGANPNIIFWKNVAKHDMLNDTMDALWWSYQQLNPDIRRCFEFCNVFPRRFRLEEDQLVRLWIAQGFVKTSCATEEMEDVAEGYIQELVSCSFLEPQGDYFTIHDLLHDLAHKVAGSDFFRIENQRSQRGEGWKGDVPRDVRHLFVEKCNAELITKKILELENLRTLIIYVVKKDTTIEEKVIESICMSLPKLRVLAIAFKQKYYEWGNPSDKLLVPESVIELKHLRYLAFRRSVHCKVILPSALAKLLHIQLLDFGYGEISEFNFSEFINLRHILCLCGSFPNIGRLSSLQTLPYFRVRNEEGYEIKQLRDLNKLRGELWMKGLENVKSKEEALEANLAAKESLTELTLYFSGYNSRSTAEVAAEVLEGLCPPVGLERLFIRYYSGFTVRNEEGYEIKQLRDLNKLRGRLMINGLEHVKSKEEALEANLAVKERLMSLTLIFSCFHRCHSAEAEAEVLEGLCPPVGLEALCISYYNGSRYPDWMVGKLNGGPKDLQILEFCHCSRLGPGPELEAFPHLRTLSLEDCSWDALPSNLEHLTSLKALKIEKCMNIRSLPTLPQSLKEFHLFFCDDELVKGCQTEGDLNWLKIKHIPETRFYPRFTSSTMEEDVASNASEEFQA
ncbi:hypothetical protein ACQJBY_000026 [Aegilops geniculata]